MVVSKAKVLSVPTHVQDIGGHTASMHHHAVVYTEGSLRA